MLKYLCKFNFMLVAQMTIELYLFYNILSKLNWTHHQDHWILLKLNREYYIFLLWSQSGPFCMSLAPNSTICLFIYVEQNCLSDPGFSHSGPSLALSVNHLSPQYDGLLSARYVTSKFEPLSFTMFTFSPRQNVLEIRQLSANYKQYIYTTVNTL